jgi:hypothetical protein
MRLDRLPGNVNLTYCTNIHAGESWPDIRASLDAHVPAIKAAVAPDRALGIGLRLSGEAAASSSQRSAATSLPSMPSRLVHSTACA